MALYTNQGAWSDKGVLGIGAHPPSLIFIIMFPRGSLAYQFGLKYISTIYDIKMIFLMI